MPINNEIISNFPTITKVDSKYNIIGLETAHGNFLNAKIGTVIATALQTDQLTVTGGVYLQSSDMNLGPVESVHIEGGSQGQVLSTDGAGNLRWITPGGGNGNGNGTVTSVSVNGGSGISTLGSPITSDGTIIVENTGVLELRPGSDNVKLTGTTGVITISVDGGSNSSGVQSVSSGSNNVHVSNTAGNVVIMVDETPQRPNYFWSSAPDDLALSASQGDNEVFLKGNVSANYSPGTLVTFTSLWPQVYTITSSANTIPGPSGFVAEGTEGYSRDFIVIYGTDVEKYIPNGSHLCFKAQDPTRPSPLWRDQIWAKFGNARVVHDYHNIDYGTRYDSDPQWWIFGMYGNNDVYVAIPGGRTTITLDRPLEGNVSATDEMIVLGTWSTLKLDPSLTGKVDSNGILNLGTWVAPPTANNSPGIRGQIAMDNNYMYVCTSDNTWSRTRIDSWW